MAIVGTFILAFGWFGFNPGSTLSGGDFRMAIVATNTMLAGTGGALTAMLFVMFKFGKPDPSMMVNGLLAGLVAITAPCYWVSPTGSFIIGIVAGIVVVAVTDLLEYLRIDDPIGAVPVHMGCGIWGTLSLGLFATGQFGLPTPMGVDPSVIVKGLFYGGGTGQLTSQFIGSAAITGATLVAAIVVMYAVKATGTLRVSAEGEMEGLDLHEHGMLAYPEFVVHTYEPTPHQLVDRG